MSIKRQLVKAIREISKYLRKDYLTAIKKQIIWLLRTCFFNRRRQSSVNAGFVLPTVAMVALVVVLLTTAILFRSFERSKNASNVRVNEAVLNAALPAIDRANAKLEQLLNDPSLPRSTPTDIALYEVIKNSTRYNFGDETRLKLATELNGTSGIQTSSILENDETLNTAWKFPVDTDNNGKFDSYTLYAIYFRSPPRNTTNQFSRARKTLDARTPPMDKSQVGGACADSIGTSASLIGDSSWYKSGGNLSKSFFVYTVSVPIDALGTLDNSKYEIRGNRGFSALEYQQDRERIPVNNKAVWFENDLEITPGSALLLNGSIHTNGNLLAGTTYNGEISFRQVSSKNSCFYEQENAKITIGGNVGTGGVNSSTDIATGALSSAGTLRIDLFRGYKEDPWTADQSSPAVKVIIGAATGHKSTTATGGQSVSHNDAAYNQRISKMKEEALGLCTSCTATATNTVALYKTAVDGVARYPQVVKDNFKSRVDSSTTVIDLATAKDILGEEIENYLKDRTRRVPFGEVSQAIPSATQALGSTYAAGSIFGTGTGVIEVPAEWREITTANTGLTLNLDKLEATETEKQKNDGKENYAGDRVLIGNNLPAFWKNSDGAYVSGQKARQGVGSTTYWNDPTTELRTRASQIQPQLSLGQTDRNQFWEQKAVEDNSANPLSNVGGLRVITGAGIYVDDNGITGDTPSFPRSTSFLPNPTLDPVFVGAGVGQMPTPQTFDASSPNIVVWSDTMPMTSPSETKKGDLLMRATAVYHFKDNAGTAQTPIACVSSYYDPTNSITAQNLSGLKTNWTNLSADPDTTAGKSNNGIVYAPPARTISAADKTILTRQSRLVFPNGRIANESLRKAMQKYTSNGDNFTNFTMADYSAVDTALCALSILNGATPATGAASKVPPGAIREAAFLDAREIKAIQSRTDYQTGIQGDYGLRLEQRQPLEIRVTELDLDKLATTTIATTEYLLPKSGIIYATRDDALRDLSYATIDPSAPDDKKELFSQTDFKLDPTRRPNGIRLINGSNLARTGSNTATYDPSEKGLILVSNLPAYLKGNFNLHQVTSGATQIEEFSAVDDGTNFYSRSGFNNNFACRPGRGVCPSTGGDLWRPATILADAITLLSSGFQDGFRSDGDYDLNNNAASIPADVVVNNFVTNASGSSSWTGTAGSPITSSKNSYNANGVTPIQRRATFNEYLMEVCTKVPASTCGDGDWYIKPDLVTPSNGLKVKDITFGETLDIGAKHQAGTTAQLAASQYRGFARRVAFLRDSNDFLLNKAGSQIAEPTLPLPSSLPIAMLPVPIGIDSGGKVQKYSYDSTTVPNPVSNTLWFKTTNSPVSGDALDPTTSDYYNAGKPLFIQKKSDGKPPSGKDQPQLVPVLQIYSPEGSPGGGSTLDIGTPAGNKIQRNWVQIAASNTIYNTGLAAGNSPSRPEEQSAGLQAFVRYLENWKDINAKIRGNFIQFQRSSYATAPLSTILSATASSTTGSLSIFGLPYNKYLTDNGSPAGTLPYYWAPGRDWGFDVGLLSQLPDLFAQRFTVPPSSPPTEYFREVGRDDDWVKTLLCAKEPSSGSFSAFSVPASYRPSDCITTAYPS